METDDHGLFGEIEVRPLSSVRKVIGKRLTASWTHVPHVAQFDEIDLTELEALRQRLKPGAEAEGAKLTLLAFVLKASALALGAFPEVNASLDEKAENLVLKKYCHIGFAVDAPGGLLVPVIQNVDKRSLLQIAKEVARLSEKARAGRLAYADVEGGCFTVSNLGQLGGTGFTPTILAPQVAILGMARAGRKVVDLDGEIASRLVLPLSLVYDHRVLDGVGAGRFMAYLREQLAEPSRLVG